MNWSLFFSTFILIFLAELGDKTQLAVMSQSAVSSSKWTVFAAGALALTASTLIGVLAGGLLRRFVPDPRVLKGVGGLIFLLFGGLMLREVFQPRPEVLAASVAPGRLPSDDWLGRFVMQQAVVFERAAFEDYTALAAQAADPQERAVFERLALEERWHYEAMTAAVEAAGERDIPITTELAQELPVRETLIFGAAGAPDAIKRAIEHERAMARFYRTLARQSKIPRLRETFLALAMAEENHAKRLDDLLK